MSYMGMGTVKESWQQAQNLIAQQTGIMVTELVDKDRQIAALKRRVTDTERALESYKAKPDSYSEGWYVKELGKAREARQVLESNLRRQTEFGKLKDRAKIKVERTRDAALRENENLKKINNTYRVSEEKVRSLEAANEQQAIAWKRSVEQLNESKRINRRLMDENQRLLEVIRLGRAGLEGEQW